MTVLIKLAYAGAVATLLILSVAFGIQTFYSGPDEPRYPDIPIARPLSPNDPAQQAIEEEQRRYQEAYERFLDDRASYRRNVFLAATVFALVAVAAGVSIPAQLDALRLGLVGGGLGMLVYAIIQAGGDLNEAGSALVFLMAMAALIVIVGAGYRWLKTIENQARP